MKIDCKECHHCYYFHGYRIGKDHNMPQSCWLSYLPGDEPGYRCDLTDESCGIIEHIDCPLYDETDDFICTILGITGYCDQKCDRIILYDDGEEEVVICPDSKESIDHIIIEDKYIVGVTNMKTLKSFDKDPLIQQQIRSNFEKAILLIS